MKKLRTKLTALVLGLAIAGAVVLAPSPASANYTEWSQAWGEGEAWGGVGGGNANDGIWGARAYDGIDDDYAVVVQFAYTGSNGWRTAAISSSIGEHVYNHHFVTNTNHVFVRTCRESPSQALLNCQVVRALADDGTDNPV